MGKHTPLPSDPIAKAAEKKRRFKVYQKGWRKQRNKQRREERASKALAKAKRERAEQQALNEQRQATRRRLNLDLISEL